MESARLSTSGEGSTASRSTKPPTGTLKDLHHECFACGIGNHAGLNLHFHLDHDGIANAVWKPSPAFRSYPDRVHGGVIATVLDSSIVHALFAKGVAGVTAELTIRYLHSVTITEPIHVRGWVESHRHGMYRCLAEVHQAGVLAVRASAKFMAMPNGDETKGSVNNS